MHCFAQWVHTWIWGAPDGPLGGGCTLPRQCRHCAVRMSTMAWVMYLAATGGGGRESGSVRDCHHAPLHRLHGSRLHNHHNSSPGIPHIQHVALAVDLCGVFPFLPHAHSTLLGLLSGTGLGGTSGQPSPQLASCLPLMVVRAPCFARVVWCG